MSRGRAAAAACRLALNYQNAGLRSVAGTGSALTQGLEATARSSLPYILTQLLQRDGLQSPFQAAFAVRPLTAAATPDSKAGSGSKQQQGGADKDGKNALTVDEEEINAITDQIPQRPMGVVEGTSYTVIIIAGIAMAVAVLWAVVNELLIQPREYTAFNLSLQKLRDDPRIMVMIGTPVSGYGQETHSRTARQRIPHKVYSDSNGREHVQVQFIARGPSGKGRVSADMYQDEQKQWQHYYLLVDLDGGRGRISIVEPHPM